MDDLLVLHTIGHSTLASDELAGLLRDFGIAAVADVRSVPASRVAPQHDRPALERYLTSVGIGYVYLGDLLGGRPASPAEIRDDGRVDYAAKAATAAFARGLDRLTSGMTRMPVAVLCAEAAYTGCHRRMLIGRALAEPDVRPSGLGPVTLAHIGRDGTCVQEPAASLLGEADLFGQRTWASAHRVT